MRNENTIVFDIGGTWFRSGLYTKTEGLKLLSKQPAYNYKNTPHKNVRELQNRLVEYLCKQVRSLQTRQHPATSAAISMGAAVDGHTGEILNSGPLWGPDCEPFDLLTNLREKMPEIKWAIINDVSAALLRHVNNPEYAKLKRICLITVSSGIACRTYDQQRNYIPLNKAGIQGEIGHIPINFSIAGKSLNATCDCGGMNHLNAFSSGRGIESILHTLNTGYTPEQFFKTVQKHNEDALEILDSLTYPLAQMIIYMLTIDSEIDKIVITGGVVHSIEEEYIRSLLKNLRKIGIYQMPNQSKFFETMIQIGENDDNSGLIGAALI